MPLARARLFLLRGHERIAQAGCGPDDRRQTRQIQKSARRRNAQALNALRAKRSQSKARAPDAAATSVFRATGARPGAVCLSAAAAPARENAHSCPGTRSRFRALGVSCAGLEC